MGAIKINVPAVLSAGSQVQKAKKIVTVSNKNVQSVKSQLDRKILSRNGISGKFNNINSQMKTISQTIDKINSFVDGSANKYYRTEQRIRMSTADLKGRISKSYSGKLNSGRVLPVDYNKTKKTVPNKRQAFFDDIKKACCGTANAVVSKVKDVYSNAKAFLDKKENWQVIKQWGKSAIKIGQGLVKIVGAAAAFETGAGIPVAILLITSAGNDIINAGADIALIANGLYDDVEKHDVLKDFLMDRGRIFGSEILDDEELGEKIGERWYIAINAVTLLDGADKMLKALGKVNTDITNTTRYSSVWGYTSFDDVLDNKIKFNFELDYFVRKFVGTDPSSTANLVFEAGKNIYKVLKKSKKLGGQISNTIK